MSGPLRAPWTDTGHLQSDIHKLQSRIRDCAKEYELNSAKSDISRLEQQVREFDSRIYELSSQITTLEDKIRDMDYNNG